MTSLRLLRAAPLGVAAAFALTLSAAAQTPPPAGGAPPAGRHMPPGAPGDRMQMREHMRQRMAEHRAKMIADWTQVLKLTPAQAQALTAAMTPPERPDHAPARAARAAMANETTLQRLDRMQARMADREGRMHAHLAAMRAFYTSLSPDQQKSFDVLSRMNHRGMMGHHRGMGGRMGGHRGWDQGGPGGPGGERGPGDPGGRGMRRGPPPPPAGE